MGVKPYYSKVPNQSGVDLGVFNKKGTAGSIAVDYQKKAESSIEDSLKGLEDLFDSFGGGGTGGTGGVNTKYQNGIQDSLGALDNVSGGLKTVYGNLGQISQSVDPVLGNLDGIRKGLSNIRGQLDGNYGKLGEIGGRLSGIGNNVRPISENGANIGGYLDSARENAYRMNQYAQESADAAGLISGEIGRIHGASDRITNMADQMEDYSPLLEEYGRIMAEQGQQLVDRGNVFLGDAQNLMDLDSSGGGLIGEYIASLGAIDPDQYVSAAAADVAASFKQMVDQQNRQLGRSGVDAGSARSVALNQQLGQMKAMASAAAKTRARRQGVAERHAAIRGAAQDAGMLSQLGSGLVGQGMQGQGAGAGIIAQAAENLARAGALHGTAGQLGVAAGGLRGDQARALTAAGQLEGASGQLQLGAANADMDNQRLRLSAADRQLAVERQQADLINQIIANANQQAGIYGKEMETQESIMRGQGLKINAENARADALKAISGNEGMKINANTALSEIQSKEFAQRLSAAQALAQARLNAANYYNQQSTDWGKIAGTGGLFTALFGGNPIWAGSNGQPLTDAEQKKLLEEVNSGKRETNHYMGLWDRPAHHNLAKGQGY